MKKLCLAAILISIIVCSALAVPLLLKTVSPRSNGGSLFSSTNSTTPEPTPMSTSSSPLPSSSPQSTSSNLQDIWTSVAIPSPLLHAPNRTIEEAIGNATEYMARQTAPYAILNNNVMYRQFGIPQFADSAKNYDIAIAGKSDLDPTLRLFRRIAFYDNQVYPSDFDALEYDVDKITVPALYSDRRPLPSNYSEMLQNGLAGGGYLTTHTLLAMFWLKENNCTVALPSNFMDSLYQATAALINNDTEVEDLEIEAAALLYEAGQGQLVPNFFIKLVIANQNMDGGWAPVSTINPNMSAWHPTFLALLLLLNVVYPSNTTRLWLAPPPAIQSSVAQTAPNVIEVMLCVFLIFVFALKLMAVSASASNMPLSSKLPFEGLCAKKLFINLKH